MVTTEATIHKPEIRVIKPQESRLEKPGAPQLLIPLPTFGTRAVSTRHLAPIVDPNVKPQLGDCKALVSQWQRHARGMFSGSPRWPGRHRTGPSSTKLGVSLTKLVPPWPQLGSFGHGADATSSRDPPA